MKKTLHIVTFMLSLVIVMSDKDQEQVSKDLEKVFGNKTSIDELTTSELVNTIDVLKKHIMA